MYDVFDEIFKEGKVEGRAEGKIEGKSEGKVEGGAYQLITIINNLMKNLHCSLEEACEYAGKTVEEYGQARKFL